MIDHDGIWVRRYGRKRLMRFDDIARIDGRVVYSAFGFKTRVKSDVAVRLREILAGPQQDGDALASYCVSPHASRVAASTLLRIAEQREATDVHIEPQGDDALVRLREAGELETLCELPERAARRLTAVLKGWAGCLPYRRDRVQEGRIPRDGVAADIRASFIPTALGERVALRLFGKLRSLDELGLDDATRSELETLLSRPRGLLVVAGGSGAGKTTTLYAALLHLSRTRAGKAHLSLEDPVEQRLRVAGVGVDQVELDPERGRSAEEMLVAALRQDVDVLSVGEIRTAREAALAVEAAHTGRLVLAGLHAGTLDEASVRLTELGVDTDKLTHTLVGTMYQELETVTRDGVRTRCLHAQIRKGHP